MSNSSEVHLDELDISILTKWTSDELDISMT
jgi:hypothetical protein